MSVFGLWEEAGVQISEIVELCARGRGLDVIFLPKGSVFLRSTVMHKDALELPVRQLDW